MIGANRLDALRRNITGGLLGKGRVPRLGGGILILLGSYITAMSGEKANEWALYLSELCCVVYPPLAQGAHRH